VVHRCADFGMAEQKILGDGVVTGTAAIDGRKVYVFAQDFTVFGGSLSGAHAQKICKVMDLAMKVGVPVDRSQRLRRRAHPGGRRVARRLRRHLPAQHLASGVVPQISRDPRPLRRRRGLQPAITDFMLMVEGTSYMFITGPDVIKTVTHEEVTKRGARRRAVHNAKSGVAHLTARTTRDCLAQIRELLGYLPSEQPREAADRPLTTTPSTGRPRARSRWSPTNPKALRHARRSITKVVDDGHFLEVQAPTRRTSSSASPASAGMPVGIVGNQPQVLAGVLDIDELVKAARFVRFCDCFNIPL
jgi:propionyl-CoA carboxylase beta chain